MKFILTGANAGKTMKVNVVQFVNGEGIFKGELAKMGGLIAYLASYNAYPVGSEELAHAQIRDHENAGGIDGTSEVLAGPAGPDTGGAPADISGTGTGSGPESVGASTDGAGTGSEGDGVQGGREVDEGKQAPSPDAAMLKIIDGINSLDPSVDDHWTDAGLPRVDAVAHASGVVSVTRKDIEAAMPGWNREKAMDAV